MKYHVAEAAFTKMFPSGQGSFNCHTLANFLNSSTGFASDLIQAQLREQNRAKSNSLYVIHRTGRTRGATWHVGTRAADAREGLRQYGNDIVTTWRRGVNPFLNRIAALNPAAANDCQTMFNALEHGALTIMEATIKTVAP